MEEIAPYLEKITGPRLTLEESPHQDLAMVVVIPIYKERFEVLKKTLDALIAAHHNDLMFECFLLFNNAAEDEKGVQHNQLCYDLCTNYLTGHDNFHCFWHQFDSRKESGVGHARKMAMDLAASRFAALKKDGLIINLDADTIVETNYFVCIKKAFAEYRDVEAMGLAFAHQQDWTDEKSRQAIIHYELHLRYFINMQRLLGLPFAFQTIGSAMVCRASAYAKEGGMVKRQAGEDFYFLHKFIRKNKFRDLNDTLVYPSSRTSDRVPFGTGKAVSDHLESNSEFRLSYHPTSFELLGTFLKLEMFFNSDEGILHSYLDKQALPLKAFFVNINFVSRILQIRKQTKSLAAFQKRFFRFFDAFQLMKYLHHMRYAFPDVKINECVSYLFKSLDIKIGSDQENLSKLRSFDLNRDYASEVRDAVLAD